MAKVNYRTCDICGDMLKTDIRFRGYMNGFRICNKMFNGLDICDKCMENICYMPIDKKTKKILLLSFSNKKRNMTT